MQTKAVGELPACAERSEVNVLPGNSRLSTERSDSISCKLKAKSGKPEAKNSGVDNFQIAVIISVEGCCRSTDGQPSGVAIVAAKPLDRGGYFFAFFEFFPTL